MSEPVRIGVCAEKLQAAIERAREACSRLSDEDWESYRDAEHRARIVACGLPASIEAAMLSGEDEHGRRLRETDAERGLLTKIAKGKRLIVLEGNPGTGKTYAAARWLVSEEGSGWLAAAHIEEIAPWSKETPAYRYVQRLVVDDLGLESDRARSRIEGLLYDRHAEGKVTVCTTNLSAEDFRRAYNGRIISRIREVGAWVSCRQVVRPGEPDAAPEQMALGE